MPSIVISAMGARLYPGSAVADPLDRHPHARAVLRAALPPDGHASHAYLFHGPAGAGKREAARAFAAELLADGAADPDDARRRVVDGVHPDLTWVRPSGAAEMLVGDIDEPVVAAATRTPFEARRRVFVIERADTMNDQAANKMLKTLEEPPAYAHLVLLTDKPGNVLPTIASRCQAVRFERASAAELSQRLQTRHGVPPATADACARLSLGDAERALALALAEGPALRHAAESYARAALHGTLPQRPWAALLEQARARGDAASQEVLERVDDEAELLPDREAKRLRKEAETTIARRAHRRAHAATIDHGLQLAGLWLRDVACVLDGAPELVHHSDRADDVAADANETTASSDRLRDAVSLVEEARTMLILNPTEELALEALASRLERLLRD
jgi:DNA polymerase-3 subunit delta'